MQRHSGSRRDEIEGIDKTWYLVAFEGRPLEGKEVMLDHVGLPDLVSAKTDAKGVAGGDAAQCRAERFGGQP
ncbi:hypothetical protein AU381_02465 [Sinorhizobium glycinis]|uniref:Uncharacterized protein n=1 Tax=Sinorhizobium glycinis TaxID=1472378 RepID=A0A178XZX8_9HYPH|nr:hypothetical protein AU381_02465 [Sinorhizobium glycinis]